MKINKTKKILAVLKKDLKSELKTRYGISLAVLFALSAISSLAFALAGETASPSLFAGLLMATIFFVSAVGLSRIFIAEEERGTAIFLKTLSSPASVYFGKLLYSILFSLFQVFLSAALFVLFFPSATVKNALSFCLSLSFISVAAASISAIISAIVSKAKAKISLFSTLAFPLFLPVIILGVGDLEAAISGASPSELLADFQTLFGYSGAVVALSFVLFHIVWDE